MVRQFKPPGMRHAALALLLGAACALAACNKPVHEDQGLTLHVGDQQYTVQSALSAAGEDRPMAYRIQWSNFIGGPAVIAAQTGGSVDVGWMAETPLVFAQAAGSPVKVVAVARGLRPGASNIALVTAADSPIRSIADLKGKRVGYSPGTITQYLVVRALATAGLTLKDVTTVQLSSFNPALLKSGAVDAYATAEPMLSQGLDEKKIKVLAYGGEPLTPGFSYLVASDAALADPKRAAAIADFVSRVARATHWRRDNVVQAAPTVAKAFNVSPQIAEQILRRNPNAYVPIDASIVARQQAEADLFHQFGLIPARVDATALFDHRFDQLVAQAESGR